MRGGAHLAEPLELVERRVERRAQRGGGAALAAVLAEAERLQLVRHLAGGVQVRRRRLRAFRRHHRLHLLLLRLRLRRRLRFGLFSLDPLRKPPPRRAADSPRDPCELPPRRRAHHDGKGHLLPLLGDLAVRVVDDREEHVDHDEDDEQHEGEVQERREQRVLHAHVVELHLAHAEVDERNA